MKRIALAAALALPALVTVAPQQADACAMRRRPVVVAEIKVPKDTLALARQSEQQGKTRLAIRQYEQAMHNAKAPETIAEAAYGAARLHAKEGRADRAMSRLNRALAVHPGHHAARLAYAEGLIAESPAEAKEHLTVLAGQVAQLDVDQQRRLRAAEAAVAAAAVPADALAVAETR